MLFINVRYLINVNISLYNFRQALESPKSSNSIGCICPKNTFLQVTHYIQRIYLTLLSTTVKIHQIHFWDHKLIFAIQIVCIFLAQTLHTSDKNIPLRCKILNFPLLELKFTKFLMSFFKQKVSLSSKFEPLFIITRDNSSALV